MITVIGQINCGKCEMTKKILNEKNINYNYLILEDLTSEDRIKYIEMARSEKILSMPLLIKNNKLISLQGVI